MVSLDTTPGLFKRSVDKYGNRVALREKVLGLWQDISWNQKRFLSRSLLVDAAA